MRKSKALAKIRSGELIRCSSLGHFVPMYVAHAARFGFDVIWLDLEHRAMEQREIQAILAYCRVYDIDCMLRTPTREKARLYRYLEDGATGLMIPHVNTAAEAQALAQSVKFPPIGDRGLDNAGFDSDFRVNPDLEAYAEWANRETFLTVQIETPEAVENAEAIAAVDGVDMLFIGPGDLGFRLRKEGDTDGSRMEAAIENVAAACARTGKAWAIPVGGPDDIRKRREQGAHMLANCGDFMSMSQGLESAMKDFEGADS